MEEVQINGDFFGLRSTFLTPKGYLMWGLLYIDIWCDGGLGKADGATAVNGARKR
jgi:hypothetical protein